ncbi:MAG: winged helix-turn-helix domain-containing protein, partial [Brachybacterium sp.]|nr:winged helix-turn-helix domain-containing protein [Brachybacterium sp.]
ELRLFRGDEQLVSSSIRRKGLQMLAWFLLNPNKPCSAEQIACDLWPEANHEHAMNLFDVNMHALKRMLEPDLGPRQPSAFITRHPNRIYNFDGAGAWWSDVADVNLHYHRGHACELSHELQQALYYYRRIAEYASRPTIIEGEDAAWLVPFRRKHAFLCAQAIARSIHLNIDMGHEEEMLEAAYQMLRVDRHNELATRVIVVTALVRGDYQCAEDSLAMILGRITSELGIVPPSSMISLRRLISAWKASGGLTIRETRPQVSSVRIPTARAATRSGPRSPYLGARS